MIFGVSGNGENFKYVYNFSFHSAQQIEMKIFSIHIGFYDILLGEAQLIWNILAWMIQT